MYYEEIAEEDYQYGLNAGFYTGDGRQDLDYDRDFTGLPLGSGMPAPGAPHNMPDMVHDFLLYLYKAVTERNIFEIQNLYESTYAQLTDTYFKSKPWPDENEVTAVVGTRENYDVFIIFYKELYFRHIYAKCQPTIEQRCDSYANYCSLFNLLLNAKEPIAIELPNQWLWDIIDEFIYQFQSFSLFRMKASAGKLSDYEMAQLKDNLKVWNVHSVLNVLHCLVDKSKINEQLREYNSGRDPDLVADEFGKQSLYKMLGYFSLIGLLRLHSLLGDYYQAIKVLENIDIHRQPLQNLSIARVLACQMTTFYYVGFAYMMMRRYADAIRTFCNILVYLQRTRQMYHQYRTFQMDMIEKQTDQMYVLLNICLVLHPQRVDESVSSVLHEKYGDSMNKMQRLDIAEFENAFRYACPKFLSPVAVIFENDQNLAGRLDPWKQQLQVFMDEVHQQKNIIEIRSFLKLYTTISVAKLADFMKMDEKTLKVHLLAYKHKMQNMVWTEEKGKSGLEGEFLSGSDVDFYIDKNMIHVADTKVARRYGDYFLRQIHKFEELYRIISSL
ncbi:eukaryotic translation initiation factor 3 subunit L-like isoform X1 [Dinothrombium tinctorium]|uniref:Eukaryotic translation initiation factor 3 subunit L n=1 Tax=Dinothrombium tinctorium TaxID=1965070 RepID=A0A3S3P285_9ACAR|nr:eukaryotic translation initiation factor 3 subunit L-like isoform X1 [Dinothrombium tinctorium]